MPKTLVLDANILMRAVLGKRVAKLLNDYADKVLFVTVDEAFEDAQTYLPQVITKRKGGEEVVQAALDALVALKPVVQTIDLALLTDLEATARERLRGRDEDDWPYLALALRLHCPIWTEDTDFFGCGAATWTSDRITLFLEADSA